MHAHTLTTTDINVRPKDFVKHLADAVEATDLMVLSSYGSPYRCCHRLKSHNRLANGLYRKCAAI